MAITIGMGKFVYEVDRTWANLMMGHTTRSGVRFEWPSACAVDSQDRVYVFQRGGPPVLVFDSKGTLVHAWPRKKGILEDAHHIYISPNDRVFLADRDAQQVLIYNTEGELLQALGTRYRASLQAPFNHPSDAAVAPSGDIYISDGYANSSVHRFSSSGRFISSFGSPGRGPGQFNVPHSIRISNDGRVYVCDRENNRVQVFTAEGKFIAEWTDFKSPMGVHIDADQNVYVTDQVPRISILDLDGNLLARGRTFEFMHNVFTDSRGNIYGVDTTYQTVQKLVKKS
jgi:peptidylglycine monooxygenase